MPLSGRAKSASAAKEAPRLHIVRARATVQQRIEEGDLLFDSAIVEHGYALYLRDYEVTVEPGFSYVHDYEIVIETNAFALRLLRP
jgi:hypothetical protein